MVVMRALTGAPAMSGVNAQSPVPAAEGGGGAVINQASQTAASQSARGGGDKGSKDRKEGWAIYICMMLGNSIVGASRHAGEIWVRMGEMRIINWLWVVTSLGKDVVERVMSLGWNGWAADAAQPARHISVLNLTVRAEGNNSEKAAHLGPSTYIV